LFLFDTSSDKPCSGSVPKLPLIEKHGRNLYANLFMDYETFGEHQWSDTGIFDFLWDLPHKVLKNDFFGFCQPRDVIKTLNYEPDPLSIHHPVSWPDCGFVPTFHCRR